MQLQNPLALATHCNDRALAVMRARPEFAAYRTGVLRARMPTREDLRAHGKRKDVVAERRAFPLGGKPSFTSSFRLCVDSEPGAIPSQDGGSAVPVVHAPEPAHVGDPTMKALDG